MQQKRWQDGVSHKMARTLISNQRNWDSPGEKVLGFPQLIFDRYLARWRSRGRWLSWCEELGSLGFMVIVICIVYGINQLNKPTNMTYQDLPGLTTLQEKSWAQSGIRNEPAALVQLWCYWRFPRWTRCSKFGSRVKEPPAELRQWKLGGGGFKYGDRSKPIKCHILEGEHPNIPAI